MNVTKRTALGIFLFVAGIYATTLNSWNAKYFGLQAATVAGLAEQGSFALRDQVIPGFNLVEGDETFRYGKNVYPMKQPGQTALGAVIYYPLYKLNFNFVNHYDYVVHFITFFTSTIMMATVATLVYLLAYTATKDQLAAVTTSQVTAFGTIIWPYAGVMHHDIYATFFAMAAISTYFHYVYRKHNLKYLWLTGTLMGAMLFFSMLPVTLPLSLLLIIAVRKNLKEILVYVGGLLVGLLPSFTFNYSQFGNFFLFPNLAGKVADTVPVGSIANFFGHLYFYLGSPRYSLFFYSPVLLFGIAGILQLPKKYLELRRLLLLLPLFLLTHVSLQATYGDYQYGPRYLLPILPILSLGTAFFLTRIRNKKWQRLFYIALVYSSVVAAIGSVQTVMFPVSSSPVLYPGQFGPWDFLKSILAGQMPEFRMLAIGVVLITAALGYVITLNKKGKEADVNKHKKNQY